MIKIRQIEVTMNDGADVFAAMSKLRQGVPLFGQVMEGGDAVSTFRLEIENTRHSFSTPESARSAGDILGKHVCSSYGNGKDALRTLSSSLAP